MNAPYLPSPVRSKSGCGCGGSTTKSGCGCGCGGAGCDQCSAKSGYMRPRFFAGQLLTEDDLQALADYVAEKNRLHNRNLIGTGVVCGLEVTCHPCGNGRITVHPGHALDCCGNDIVLACMAELDVNAMIRDLRRDQLGGYDCGDPCKTLATTKNGGGTSTGTKTGSTNTDDFRTYCLYVRYCEEETEPVAPYSTGEPCGASACEPTRIREGLRLPCMCTSAPAYPARRRPRRRTSGGQCRSSAT